MSHSRKVTSRITHVKHETFESHNGYSVTHASTASDYPKVNGHFQPINGHGHQSQGRGSVSDTPDPQETEYLVVYEHNLQTHRGESDMD